MSERSSRRINSGVLRCLLVMSMLAAVPAYAGIPDQMKQMIEQKRAEDAYQLGLKHPELLGDVYFDYVFGTAAVDAGRPSVGVLALERVLLNNPNNNVARLELARAYFVLGEYQRSREEFEDVKKRNPPPGAVVTIDQYLEAIKDKESATKISGGVYAE
ncbi:MAG: tetratricopeptide repeat protein, partial [Fluviibacter sp.]